MLGCWDLVVHRPNDHFASFTPAALDDAIVQEQQQRPPTAAPDQAVSAAVDTATSSGPAPAPAPGRAQHVEAEHEHSLPKCSPILEPLPLGSRLLRLRQKSLPLSDIRAFAAPGEEGGGPEDRRSYILDLAPKLVYQAEPLVDLLVRCRCHHYLEFKAVEGSYLLQDGALQPVPASRADIFRDRRLCLGEKRALMRFIQGCLEARSGQGHLQEALSSCRPLADILTAEALSQRLRDVIMYGIAMCDTDQEPPPAATAATAATAVSGGGGTGILTGAGAAASLELFISSQSRFGHEGAFMVPCYGSGSVAEAFVRLCAVHGAVTVLRQPVQALVVAEAPPLSSSAEAAAEASGSDPDPRSSAAAASVAATLPQSGSHLGHGAAEGCLEDDGAGQAATAAAGVCVGVVTATGQLVRCGAVVAASSTLSCVEGIAAVPAAAPPHEYVSRAVVVLDGSVLMPVTHGSGATSTSTAGGGGGSTAAAAPKSLLTLVVPPRCPGLQAGAAAVPAVAATAATAAAASSDSSREAPDTGGSSSSGSSSGDGLGNPHPVRVIQEGASTFLLYLSTPATSDSPYDDLWPTLSCLADTSAFPGARWLGELDFNGGHGSAGGGGGGEADGGPQGDEAGAGGGGGGGGGQVPDGVSAAMEEEEDDLAIDELTAAIARLKAGGWQRLRPDFCSQLTQSTRVQIRLPTPRVFEE
ncbi:hypothetical protein VOLCADRAFT_106962 [Volvox carteri f. nagariensis]|uniref:Uncharacterized protein n=1 Tax=Volvox carteri f. nagariensis TaxID=3068 RepID=D8UAY2_VOLCA|nr:uncharacterized protein VOLCADRAFT_106962 [Volvox carteri f. nagariensis]EFJ43075.1 hypothetical protein VOLCADRAFT_106962 [Volvox carteri f. nagariensis]|eukprot:XP_002955874.1 hypothetical protein VOLCADRAFT_106962 [Volvox carteri f. nagariensis]